MTLTKDAIIGFLVLIIALGGLFWYLGAFPAPFSPGSSATSTPAGVTGPQTIEEHAEYYDIEATYPGRTPLNESSGASADAAAVATMKAWQEETIAQFKADGGFANLSAEDIAMFGYADGRKQALQIDYELYMGDRTVSYEYTVFADTFGAHPNAYMRTFTFDALTGKELALADIFDGKAPYLAVLSEKSRAVLIPHIAEVSAIPVAELDTTYLESGTEPTQENFQWFYFDRDDFVIVFPPYQVGPWALGRQEARIPKAELSTILRTEYR